MRRPAPFAAPDPEAGLSAGATPAAPGHAAFAVSSDGYLRLTLTAFRALALRHLFSALDQDPYPPAHIGSGASQAAILGFTEWVSDTSPAVSLGWDWRLNALNGQPRYLRDSEVRSNVMLIEPGLGDLGDLATSATLSATVDAFSWSDVIDKYISNQYGWHLSDLTVTPH